MNISSTTQHLSDVRRFVQMHAEAAGFTEETIEQFKLAVDEACTNVIKHAYRDDDGGRIEISILVNDDRFVVTIRDEGRSFEIDKYRTPDIYQSIRNRKAGGYGIHLMRSLMDSVEYRQRGGSNEVQLTKFRQENGTAQRSK